MAAPLQGQHSGAAGAAVTVGEADSDSRNKVPIAALLAPEWLQQINNLSANSNRLVRSAYVAPHKCSTSATRALVFR